MTAYVGIDLGTTNSVICSYDGHDVALYKSAEQRDVTPSAIYVDRRGNRLFGDRAYQQSAVAPGNTATLFKRMMGTSTKIKMPSVNLEMTPEECSAEILRVLFGYLPEAIRNDDSTGTVITVPAAFNQMQKDATLSAAELAGIGKVALMQEPVAAVMRVMRNRKQDGLFLIFDIGGGTLDIALAESTSGRVSLLEHGGVAMCGGRDFDRALVEQLVYPWLEENFSLPSQFWTLPKYQTLARIAAFKAEAAKIALSSAPTATLMVTEEELRVTDEEGREVYIDLTAESKALTKLMEPKLDEALAALKDVLAKAHLTSDDIERIVFVGGPTKYEPLRDWIAKNAGIPSSTEVDPMLAVAEGAAIFAESIDWTSARRGRKPAKGLVSSGGQLGVNFAYQARTPDTKAKVSVQVQGQVLAGTTFQIDSADSGWSSGRVELKSGATISVPLAAMGENHFRIFVFDPSGGPVSLEKDIISVVRTAASIDAIPASHSIGVAAKDRVGGTTTLAYLVKAGEPLPKKGEMRFRAEEALRAGTNAALTFKLWEGEIESPYTDNRLVGTFKIAGHDLDEGVVPAGAELICEYEVADSGTISLTVSIPSVGGSFSPGHNFYSRQEGQIDFESATPLILEEKDSVLRRLDEMADQVDDPGLAQARSRLDSITPEQLSGTDSEAAKQALDNVLEAKRLLDNVRKSNLAEIRGMELHGLISFFDEKVREHAKPGEANAFDNMAKAAERLTSQKSGEFEVLLDRMRALNGEILRRQDWFVVDRLKWAEENPHHYTDKAKFTQLIVAGQAAVQKGDMQTLRAVLYELSQLRISFGADDGEMVNILRS